MNMLRRIDPDISNNKNKFSKSKSPDSIRQKIPAFKPKKLQEIFQDSKTKKSTDSQGKLISSQDKFLGYDLRQSHEDELRLSSPANLQKTKSSLADFIKVSGHSFEIQSIQYQNSQLQDKINPCQFDGFRSQQRKPTKKLQFRVFTPQCQTFSKEKQQHDPFLFKDDSSLSNSQVSNLKKYWNGQITLATSMCQDQFQNQINKKNELIPQQLRTFIDQKSFYVFCRNQKSQNQLLLQSSKEFVWTELKEKITDFQRSHSRNQQRFTNKEKSQIKIKIVNIKEVDTFLTHNFTEEQLEKYIEKQLLPNNKFLTIVYKVQPHFRPREKIK